MAGSSVETLAAGRERRSNAGARMARLLEAEDEDDFYKTTYGGFTEEVDDNDYQSEASVSDVTDSDIDIDENDEPKSDAEDEGENKRKRRLVTKAYKEPKKAAPVTSDSASPPAPKPKVEKVKMEKIPLETAIDKTSLRKSTSEKSRTMQSSLREREARSAMMRQIAEKKRVAEVRRLTQEELLAEAKITEKINLRSLETYQRLELEKKKARVHRQMYAGPIITYHSVTDTVDPDEPSADAEINVDGDPTDNSNGEQNVTKPNGIRSADKCSRTFITFSDDLLFRRYFPHRRPSKPARRTVCAVTGLPAKYFDPLTQLPYATVEAFRIIRDSIGTA